MYRDLKLGTQVLTKLKCALSYIFTMKPKAQKLHFPCKITKSLNSDVLKLSTLGVIFCQKRTKRVLKNIAVSDL